MATNLSLPRKLVEELDAMAGRRNRSAYVEALLEKQLRRERMRRAREAAAGSWEDHPEFPTRSSCARQRREHLPIRIQISRRCWNLSSSSSQVQTHLVVPANGAQPRGGAGGCSSLANALVAAAADAADAVVLTRNERDLSLTPVRRVVLTRACAAHLGRP
jgi:hypothetical protein